MKFKTKLLMGFAIIFCLTSCNGFSFGSNSSSASTITPSTIDGSLSSTGVSAPTSLPTTTSHPYTSSPTISTPAPSSSVAPISSSISPSSTPMPISSTPVSTVVPESNNPSFTEYLYANNRDHLMTVGESINLLVIPMAFADETCSGGAGTCEATRERIHQAFFSDGDGEGHESLSSYYRKSSYGKLNITGEVTEVYQLPSLSSFLAQGYLRTTYSANLMFKAFQNNLSTAVNSFFGIDKPYQVSDYDNDGNGKIDGVWFVYLTESMYSYTGEYIAAAQDILWAFTSWPTNRTIFGSYCWASYNFMDEDYGAYNGFPDAHTFIHETGHLLGLDDYYNYDGTSSPAGCLDMMDYNILDHNAFSKYLMNWTEPTYINNPGTYNLNAFQSEGDFILLAPDWNGSQFDQYILLEYYTPTGLNKLDSDAAYPGNRIQGFTESGVKIYLIDNRVTAYPNNLSGEYVDEFDLNMNTAMVHSNTPSRSLNYFDPHPLIRLLEQNESTRFLETRYPADNSTLFQEGDSFGNEFSLYGNEEFPYIITIGQCIDESTTIRVETK